MKIEWSDGKGGVVTEERARSDEHRRGAFKPENYEFVGWYYLGSRVWGRSAVMACDEKIKAFMQTEEAGDLEALVYGDFGKCAVCGARFAMGEVWQWTDGTLKRDMVHIGWECASKYGLAGANWDALADERRRALEALRTKARRAKEKEKLFAAYAGLEAALKVDHRVVADIAGKFEQYGTLSDGQCKLVLKIAGEVSSRTGLGRAGVGLPPAPEKHVDAPSGRITVRGRVVSLKEHESVYGVCQKMTVKVVVEGGGSWLCWGTVPASIDKQIKKGDVVEFDGELEAGREKHFAFFRRPTKVSIVESVVKVAS